MSIFGILAVIVPIGVLIPIVYLVYGLSRGKIKLKNVLRNTAIILIIIAAALMVWLSVYGHSKNSDNLPGLQSLEADELQELKGYQRTQLISVWGEPDDTVSTDQDMWKLGGEEYLLVTYGTDGRVKEAVFEIP